MDVTVRYEGLQSPLITSPECSNCNKRCAVKVFINAGFSTKENDEPIPIYVLKIYTATEESLVEIVSINQCINCQARPKIKTIDQREYAIKEKIACHCGTETTLNFGLMRKSNPLIADITDTDEEANSVTSALEGDRNFRDQDLKWSFVGRNNKRKNIREPNMSSISPPQKVISLQNRFETLEDMDCEENSTSLKSLLGKIPNTNTNSKLVEPEGKKQEQDAIGKNKPAKPPTVTIQCPDQIKTDDGNRFLVKMAQITHAEIRINKTIGRAYIRAPDEKKHKEILDYLVTEGIEYHTHGIDKQRRRTKKILAKGVHTQGHSEADIIDDIEKRWAIRAKRAITFESGVSVLLIFESNVTMKEIKTITHILYQRVKMEKYKIKATAVTQCKRCLDFGHIATHCGRKERTASTISTNKEGNQVEICSACGTSGHNAKQAKCPRFQEEMERQKRRRQNFAGKNLQKRNTDEKVITKPSLITHGISYATKTRGSLIKQDQNVKEPRSHAQLDAQNKILSDHLNQGVNTSKMIFSPDMTDEDFRAALQQAMNAITETILMAIKSKYG